MSVRETINKNPTVGFGVVGGVMAIAVMFSVMFLTAGDDTGSLVYDDWYYDLESKKLFKATLGQTPPIDAPSGPNKGARAYVYSCTDCSDASSRFIGYLEFLTPESKAAESDREKDDIYRAGHMVRLEKDGDNEWVGLYTPAGEKVVDWAIEHCKGKDPQFCAADDSKDDDS